MERYLVFSYHTYYPEGGMNDCILRTNDKEQAEAQIDAAIDSGQWAHYLDTHTGEVRPHGEGNRGV